MAIILALWGARPWLLGRPGRPRCQYSPNRRLRCTQVRLDTSV